MNIKLRVKNLTRKYSTHDPFELADYLNVVIVYSNLPGNISGVCTKCCRRHLILINQDLSYLEQKIILAHELGHVILHKNKLASLQNFYSKNKLEKEANTFALELLSYSVNIDNYVKEILSKYLIENTIRSIELHNLLAQFVLMDNSISYDME